MQRPRDKGGTKGVFVKENFHNRVACWRSVFPWLWASLNKFARPRQPLVRPWTTPKDPSLYFPLVSLLPHLLSLPYFFFFCIYISFTLQPFLFSLQRSSLHDYSAYESILLETQWNLGQVAVRPRTRACKNWRRPRFLYPQAVPSFHSTRKKKASARKKHLSLRRFVREDVESFILIWCH